MIRKYVLQLFNWIFHKEKKNKKEIEGRREINHFLPKLRLILEQILAMKQINYKDFKPLFIDSDNPVESLLDEDDISQALEQISRDLNFLIILTERPEYFHSYIETMYEETGLAVSIQEKFGRKRYPANVVLDFEQTGSLYNNITVTEAIYLPIYKREWSIADNLDISVPIGYNTVIVKGD